jgi:hypothetical protein
MATLSSFVEEHCINQIDTRDAYYPVDDQNLRFRISPISSSKGGYSVSCKQLKISIRPNETVTKLTYGGRVNLNIYGTPFCLQVLIDDNNTSEPIRDIRY